MARYAVREPAKAERHKPETEAGMWVVPRNVCLSSLFVDERLFLCFFSAGQTQFTPNMTRRENT